MIFRNYRSALFESFPPLYEREGTRRSVLDLPFRREDFDGIAMPEGRRLGWHAGHAADSDWEPLGERIRTRAVTALRALRERDIEDLFAPSKRAAQGTERGRSAQDAS